MDTLFELDKYIEEHVYNRYEPTFEYAYPSLGWSKETDGRYAYWDYHYKTRTYYISEVWPRRFSTNTILSVDLAKRFRVSIKPVVNLSGEVSGYSVKSSFMSNVTVVKETLEEAICILIVMITKNTEIAKNIEVKDV